MVSTSPEESTNKEHDIKEEPILNIVLYKDSKPEEDDKAEELIPRIKSPEETPTEEQDDTIVSQENSKIEKEDESKQQIPKVGSPEEIKTGSMEEVETKELVTNIGSPVNICIKLHQTICQSSV